MNIKIDLHTHSIASPDGGISAAGYRRALSSGLLDAIAVTDHNRIDFATSLKDELGDSIIVGEEIMTRSGEIIGLYLDHAVPPDLSVSDAIAAVRAQNGIVYIPHPFETLRKGLTADTLHTYKNAIDCVEVHNGRAVFQNYSAKAMVWATEQSTIMCASSDAHGQAGLGSAYAEIAALPTRDTLLRLLKDAHLVSNRPKLRAILYPKYHTIRKTWMPKK